MRITREFLLKQAEQQAKLLAGQNRHLVCIYLTGSLLSEEPLLGNTADIDLIAINDSEPEKRREVIPLTADIHLDIGYVSQGLFRQPRLLRTDSWLSPFFCQSALCLHDTLHWFEFTQAGICSQYNRPEYVLQRARPFVEQARQSWMEMSMGKFEGPAFLLSYLRTIEKTANAIVSLVSPPLTDRRFFLQFPKIVASMQRPGLASGLVDLFLNRDLSAQDWQEWLPAWQEAFSAAAKQTNCPPALNACRLNYYARAIDIFTTENPSAALWLLLRTWSAALCVLPSSSQSWEKACQSLQLEPSGLGERLTSLDAYLDTVEETLDLWAKQNGIL